MEENQKSCLVNLRFKISAQILTMKIDIDHDFNTKIIWKRRKYVSIVQIKTKQKHQLFLILMDIQLLIKYLAYNLLLNMIQVKESTLIKQ